MKNNTSVAIGLIIIMGLIIFGGSFLVTMYFWDPQEVQNDPHLGLCDGARIYRSFEEALQNPEDVCTLQIGEGNLTEIPAEITQLRNLTYLTIVKNQLTEVPDEIGQLENLVTLYLNLNNINSVSDEIANLENLQRLQLVDNNLSSDEQNKIRDLLPGVDIRF